MVKFAVEYTTNTEDRHTVEIAGANKTDVYLKFVKDHPGDYIITDMRDVG